MTVHIMILYNEYMAGHENEHAQGLLKLALMATLLLSLVVSCGERGEEDPSATVFFSGRAVLSSDINTPIADVTVNLTDMVSNSVTGTITAADGTYKFTGLSQNRWYTIGPVPTNYTFVPELIQIYTNVNLSDADFKGTPK